ncbi:lysophospholipid acyltransferase family protein [Rhodococcus triatomae]|nr:1-acylglycerol-3-phosphate O-acyltransferase [Rhodococcus triatomae BKS 15-14]
MPHSPCGDGCLAGATDRAAPATIGLRGVGLIGLALTLPLLPAAAVLSRRRRSDLHRGYARAALRMLGVRLHVDDEREQEVADGRGRLVVAGHVSWLDVLVVGAVVPGQFVARGDLLHWPLLGSVAHRMGVVPIDRDRLRALSGVVDEVADRMRSGQRMVAFPEGTTWCGRAYGRLRPALFQAAVDADALIEPVELRYLRGDGAVETGVCFVGDQTLLQSLRRTIGLRRVEARVRLAPRQEPGTDRRELAARCEALVHGSARDAREADEILARTVSGAVAAGRG